ncbi:ribose 5-phosphate isomerase A [Tricharina praecox]|uniref:ribose 5-phosphate isomerase A n=1 Tax=Tricharina praecox TaxID=43433 RepID=UPI00221E95C1|nr:ribose 5-phosphate isomerase A [Tricharina praecox]KAI5852265.1 ribose 5-phosphate isomerase A [Tricharina praecox]
MAAIIEGAKRLAAYRAVDEHFPPNARFVGIGSGSTVVYVVERIAQLPRERTDHVVFVPTGFQSRELILRAGLKLGSVDMATEPLEVVFDGADEVDPYLNCIKGGGACLFQEKLVAISGRKFVVVADFRKLSPSLSTHYAPGVPIEVVPMAANYVLSRLSALGSTTPTIRMGGAAKAGPCITDNGNFIIDAPFQDGFIPSASSSISPPRPLSPASSAVAVDTGLNPDTGHERVGGSNVLGKEEGHPGAAVGMGLGSNENVEEMARTLKSIVGVVEHGIFWSGDRKPVMAYFGMEDGSVAVRGNMGHHS